MAYAYEEHILPSNGVLEGIPKQITLRNMTTAEEKMLLSSADDAFDSIISKCVTEPEDFDLDNCISSDRHFILIKLRALSYGPIYHFTYKCPICGRIGNYSINLDELETHYLPEDFKEPYSEDELPKTKDKIALKLPRVRDIKGIRTKARRWQSKFPEQIGDPSLIYGMMANIATVNGKVIEGSPFQRYVEELPAMDASFIRNRIARLEVGIDTTIYQDCPICGEELEFGMPMGPEFFHTRLGE